MSSVPAVWSAVITSEHASRSLPPGVTDLGLPQGVLDTHAAWDPGAAETATFLAERLAAPLFLGTHCRLFCDLNRSPGSIEAVPRRAFGVEVPGNAALTEEEIADRIRRFHAPYWSSVGRAVADRLAQGVRALHLSIHSFVEVYEGERREVDLGILLDPDRPLEVEAGEQIRSRLSPSGLAVRFNEPYDGRSDALTTALRTRFSADAYAGIEIEISQRHLGAIPRISELLLAAIEPLVR